MHERRLDHALDFGFGDAEARTRGRDPDDRMQQMAGDGDVERREAPDEIDAVGADAHFLEGLAQRRLFERLAASTRPPGRETCPV